MTSTVSCSYDHVPSALTVTAIVQLSVRNAYSRNGTEMIPLVSEPRTACSVNDFAPAAAFPVYIATWPRGIASVRVRFPVAGSHSQ